MAFLELGNLLTMGDLLALLGIVVIIAPVKNPRFFDFNEKASTDAIALDTLKR
jgi:hypothetical protein